MLLLAAASSLPVNGQQRMRVPRPERSAGRATRRAPSQPPLTAAPATAAPASNPQPPAAAMQPQPGVPGLADMSPAASLPAAAVAPEDSGLPAATQPTPSAGEALEPRPSLTPTADGAFGVPPLSTFNIELDS